MMFGLLFSGFFGLSFCSWRLMLRLLPLIFHFSNTPCDHNSLTCTQVIVP